MYNLHGHAMYSNICVFTRPYLLPLHLLFHCNAIESLCPFGNDFEILPRSAQPIREGSESILSLCDVLHLFLELFECILNDGKINQKAHCQERSEFCLISMKCFD